MKRQQHRKSELSAWIAPIALAIALVLSVLFQGFEVYLFSVVQSILVLLLLRALWQSAHDGVTIPRGPLPLLLTLFWAWFALALIWTRVWYVSVFEFWWIGTLALVFWLYTLSPGRERLRAVIPGVAVVFGALLASAGLYQFFVLNKQPVATFFNANSYAALLNLIALPIAAAFLAQSTSRQAPRWRRVALMAVFFMSVLTVSLTAGRASAITFMLGLALIMAVSARQIPWRVWIVPPVIAIAGYLIGILSSHATAVRYAELSAPLAASSMGTRMQIWEATWRMIQDAPWWGVGPGLFSLIYPQYRLPTESSAGFLVHNDYLQLWLEAGLPGLLLLLATMGAVCWCFISLLRRRAPLAQRLEIAGLVAGLATVAMHAFFDFNLHVLTILILAGLMLARVQQLVTGKRVWTWRPHKYLSVGAYRLVITLLALFPLLFFASISLAIYDTGRAERLALQGELALSDEALHRAYRVYPSADNVLVSNADLYRYILRLTPAEYVQERREVFDRAREMLDKAERLNAYRPLNMLVRGRLYQENIDLLGPQGNAEVETAFRRALALNPRFYHARLAYAQYLYKTVGAARALQVLEEGMKQYYPNHEDVIPYLSFTAKLRAETGDIKRAAELNELVMYIMSLPRRRQLFSLEKEGTLEYTGPALTSTPVKP